MANNVKYLSYEGLDYFWNQKLKPIIEENEQLTAIALNNLNNKLNTHTHMYAASAGYSASAARATYSASAGYTATAEYAATAALADKVILKNIDTASQSSYLLTADGEAKPIGDIMTLADAMVFKGVINSNTELPATHKQGWTYRVNTAGTYADKVCEVGDLIICITDGTSANNAHWTVAQTNTDGVVSGPALSVSGNIAAFNSTNGKSIYNTGLALSNIATSGHTHNYLALSGGTLTGPIALNGADTDRNLIRVNSNTSGDANQIGNYGYTLKFLGSGTGINNALALYADNQTATTQNLATKWLNDGTMYGRSILPHPNENYTLGDGTHKWANVYATTFTGNLTGNASSATLLSTPTDYVGDLDTVLRGGTRAYCYHADKGSTNGPAYYGGVLNVNSLYSKWQLFASNGTGLYFRQRWTGSNNVSEWKKILTVPNSTGILTMTKDIVLKNTTSGATPKLVFQRGDISSDSTNSDTYIDYDIYNTGGSLTLRSHDKITITETDEQTGTQTETQESRLSTLAIIGRDDNKNFYTSFNTNVMLKSSTSTGDTPALVFQRGTTADGYYDHKIYNSGGALRFQYSSGGSDIDILKLYNTASILSSAFHPGVSSTDTNTGYSLGDDTHIWKDAYIRTIHANNLTFTGTVHPHISGNKTSLTLGYSPEVGSQMVFVEGAIRRNSSNTNTTLGTSQYPWPTIFSDITKTKSIAFQGGDTDRILMRVAAGNTDPDAIGNYGYTLKYLGSGIGINNALALYVDNENGAEQLLGTKWTNDGKMYSRSILPHPNENYTLGDGTHKWANVYATTFTGNLTGTSDIAKTLPHFKISSNGELPTDGSPEYVKFATITIPTTAWVRRSVTLFFQDYEANGYQGDILTIQASTNASGVGSAPSVKWVTKYQKSTIGNIIVSKISDNVYDLYLEATILHHVTLRIFYLTLDDVGQDKTFYFISNASWSTTAPDPITARSKLNNVASGFGSARTLWGQSFDGTANVSGNMTGVGSIAMTKALTITGTDSTTANLHFGRTSYNYISGPSGSTIHMCPGGIAKDSTHGYIFSSTAFYPGTTNAYSIGTDTNQWNNIYGKTLYENGTSLDNKYLKLTGGTISSSAFCPLVIERSGSTSMAALRFKNSNGILGSIGMNTVYGSLLLHNADGTSNKTILDSSNYNTYAATASHAHSASSITSGTLSVSRGGTGLSTITAGHVIIGNGTGTPTTSKILSITNAEIDTIFAK